MLHLYVPDSHWSHSKPWKTTWLHLMLIDYIPQIIKFNNFLRNHSFQKSKTKACLANQITQEGASHRILCKGDFFINKGKAGQYWWTHSVG